MNSSQTLDRRQLGELRLELFEHLGPNELGEIAPHGRVQRVPTGTYLFQQGQKKADVYVLLEGLVKLTHECSAGHRVLFGFVRSGELFGTCATVPNGSYGRSGVAVGESVIWACHGRTLCELMKKMPRLAMNALRIQMAETQHILERFAELATKPVEQRLAHTLLRLARRSRQGAERGLAIDVPLSRQDLAEMTGTTLYTASRILSRWGRAGLIDGGRLQLVVRDEEALEKITGKG